MGTKGFLASLVLHAALAVALTVLPLFSEEALPDRAEAEVDAHGQVARVAVVHGHPLFDRAAVEAVRQWRYQPLLLSGEPTAFILTVTIRFELPR